ncbi:MAG: hypothetical protein GQ525_13830 [Draconibacterium sp.]|nr:hypothetical protein [Draconibacterium sp.]
MIAGQDFFSIPEFELISKLLKHSKQGLLFSENTIPKVHDLIFNLSIVKGPEKVITLLSVLNILRQCDYVSISGKTMKVALEQLKGHDVKTLAMKGKADFVLFPEIKDCVKWSWKA